MAWELRAIPSSPGHSLGPIEHVQAQLRAALPEIHLGRDASGADKLKAMEARGINVPEAVRSHWLSSRGAYLGLFEGDGVTIEFYLGDDDRSVPAVSIAVRGSGDPMPFIERLRAIPDWQVIDGNGAPPSAESWKSFTDWRDDAIGRSDKRT